MGIFDSSKSQKGQILLIVVLAAVVSLTVGLSAVSRVITNTRVTTEEASSQKALSAAEAGVEELVNNEALLRASVSDPLSKNFSNNSTFFAKADPIDGVEFLINDGNQILKDEGADIWFSTYPNFGDPGGGRWGGTLEVYWKDNNGCSLGPGQTADPAIEMVVIQGTDTNNLSMRREVYDRCSRSNGFSIPTLGARSIDGQGLNRGFSIIIPGGQGYIARVIPLYANAVMGVRAAPPSPLLPTQGYVIDSQGSAGNTKRSVRVFRGFPRVPIEYFPYNIFLP